MTFHTFRAGWTSGAELRTCDVGTVETDEEMFKTCVPEEKSERQVEHWSEIEAAGATMTDLKESGRNSIHPSWDIMNNRSKVQHESGFVGLDGKMFITNPR